MVVGEHGIQTFEIVLLFCYCRLIFLPHKCTSVIIYGQVVCPNILECQRLVYTNVASVKLGLFIQNFNSPHVQNHKIITSTCTNAPVVVNTPIEKKTSAIQPLVVTWPLPPIAIKRTNKLFRLSTKGFCFLIVQKPQPKTSGCQPKLFIYVFSCHESQ